MNNHAVPNSKITVKAIACCAMLAAVSIVLARFLSYSPFGSVRWSLDKFPLFLAGMLFGPLAGSMTGFVADAAGSMMQYGFNPILCPPAILFGLFGGLLRYWMTGKPMLPRLILSYLIPVVLGALLYQSAALAYCFNPNTLMASFIANLGSRAVQFAIIAPLEIAVIWLLISSKMFNRMGMWPPAARPAGKEEKA